MKINIDTFHKGVNLTETNIKLQIHNYERNN